MKTIKVHFAMRLSYFLSHLPRGIRNLKKFPVFASFARYLRKFFEKSSKPIIDEVNDAIIIQRGALKGYKIPRISTDYPLELAWALSGFEPKTRAALNKYLREGKVAFDVGANRGWLTIPMSIRVGQEGRVFAFEPVPETVELLEKTIRINNINNIIVKEVAISNQVGKTSFVYGRTGDLTAALKEIGYHGNSSQIQEVVVDTDTLDHFAETNLIKKIDLIKIDVEGGEMLVLDGMKNILKFHKPIVIVELIGEKRIKEGQEYLKAFGYNCEYLEKAPYYPHNMPPSHFVNILAVPKNFNS